MHRLMRMNNSYLLLVALIGAATPVPVRAAGVLGLDVVPGVSFPLLSVESKQVQHESGQPTFVLYTQSGALAINRRGREPNLANWGWHAFTVQQQSVAAGKRIKHLWRQGNAKRIGRFLPNNNCWVVLASEVADLMVAAAVEADNLHLPFDGRVFQLDLEEAVAAKDGDQDKYRLFGLITVATVTNDLPFSVGASLAIQNTSGWDPRSRADFHRSDAELRAELEDWYEAGITGFEPVVNNPGSQARGVRRNQQLLDGALVAVHVVYETKGIVPRTCIYLPIPEELVPTETQLAFSPQHVAGQRYTLLPKGSEPTLPANWNPAIRGLLTGMRWVVITRIINTGSEVVFEIPHQVLDLAPAIQRMVLVDGKERAVLLANILVLGVSHAGANGDPLVWQYVEGGDLLAFTNPRPTEVVVRLRPTVGVEQSIEDESRPSAPAQRQPAVPSIEAPN